MKNLYLLFVFLSFTLLQDYMSEIIMLLIEVIQYLCRKNGRIYNMYSIYNVYSGRQKCCDKTIIKL